DGYRSTDKRYSRDNRLITPESPYRRSCLVHRCWLVTSWSRKGFQGYSCSLLKVVRELSSERCETVRSLSSVKCRKKRLFLPSTKGLVGSRLLCTSCSSKSIAG